MSRRTVLGVLGGAAALAACEALPVSVPDVIAPPGPGTMPPPGGGPGVPPVPGPTAPPAPAAPVTSGPIATALTGDAATHLARRATFGPTPEIVDDIRSLGVTAWLAQQTAPNPDDDDVANAAIARFRTNLGRTSAQIFNNRDDNGAGDGGTAADEQTVNAIVYRNAYSRWQLLEKMAEFWTNHFALDHTSDDNRGRATVFQRDVIRANAFGNFADFLFAVLTDPAMMRFLDGDDNDKGSNENMAREIMELHTLGANRGYGENDIREAAKLLSGLTFNNETNQFRYNPGRHYVGPVTIRGVTYANASADAGLEAMRAFTDSLAADPLTAEYLSTKLAQTFVSDDPPASLVAALAATFSSTGGDIAAWVTALFTSAEFAASVGQKVARPLDDFIGAIRVLGLQPQGDPEEGDRLRNTTRRLLQSPGEWTGPDGYAITADKWLSSGDLLNRWNIHNDLVYGRFDNALQSADEAMDALVTVELPSTVGAVVDAVAARMVFQTLADEHRAAVLTYLGRADGDAVADAGDVRDVVRPTAVLLLDTYCMQR
jgi:uncharacterized protein (DUF1800 family)